MNLEREYIELITGLKDTLYRLARSILHSDAEAEDVVQDLYEKVWRLRDQVLRSDYPRAYLCRMAHNLAVDRLRRSTRESRFTVVENTRQSSDELHRIEVGDMATITRSLINRLPERQRVAIHMRDVEGYEIDEIAHILECDESSVRMNLSRARRAIREQLVSLMSHGDKRG